MLDVTEEVKDLFRDGRSHNYDMRLEFGSSKYFTTPEITLTSKDIMAESAKLEETLISGSSLEFGEICPSQFTCGLMASGEYVGKFLKVTIIYDGTEIPYGRFYVTECKATSDTDVRTLKAYDYLYFMSIKDVSDIWNSTHGIVHMAEAMVNYIVYMTGLEREAIHLPNNLSYTEPAQDHTTLTYADILKWIGETNGGWFRVSREGKLRFVQLKPQPVSRADAEPIETYVMGQATIGGFTAGRIDSIEYTGLIDGTRQTYKYIPEGSAGENTYVIDGNNQWFYNRTQSDLQSRMAAMYAQIKDLWYSPMTIQCDGRPYLEVGDVYSIDFISVSRSEDGSWSGSSATTMLSYVFNQSISGIGGLMHNIETRGDEGQSIGEKQRQNQINALVKDYARG